MVKEKGLYKNSDRQIKWTLFALKLNRVNVPLKYNKRKKHWLLEKKRINLKYVITYGDDNEYDNKHY